MQQTRQQILEILHERGEATVDEMVKDLRERINHDITAVTVRHHLDILRSEELITPPAIRRRRTPGRPVYVYRLADKALEHFPNNYQNLVTVLLNQIKTTLPSGQVNVFLEGVADQMGGSPLPLNVPMETRLDHVVAYLSQLGYSADWETGSEGYILHARNCPYRQISDGHPELCVMDMRLMTGLIGTAPSRIGWRREENACCDYLIPFEDNHKS